MARGERQVDAAVRLAKESPHDDSYTLLEKAVEYEIAIMDGNRDLVRQVLGQLIWKAMLAGGTRRLGVAAHLAKEAAARNMHKPGWRQCPIRVLLDKLYEEVDELYRALKDKDKDHIRYELGDVIWVATMIADHDFALVEWEAEDMENSA